MRHASLLGVLAVVLGVTSGVRAQPPGPAVHIVGTGITSNWKMEPGSRAVTDTATLTFRADAGPVYTIDFITRHQSLEPVTSPGIVDIVVTERPRDDEAPEMAMRVDGESVPLIARLRSSRSVVASMPLADLDRLTAGDVVVDRTFGTELELSAAQLKMLRATVDRWLGRVR